MKRKIFWFTDTINDLNGVSVTLKNIGWLAHKNNYDITFITSILKEEWSKEIPPNVINLKPVLHFKLPYYHTMDVKVPRIIKALVFIRQQKPDEIFISSPSIVGTIGLIAAKLFGIKSTAIYHTDFSLVAYNVIGQWNWLVKLIELYTRHFHLSVNRLLVPTKEYIDILKNRGFSQKKMSVFKRGIDLETFRPLDKNAKFKNKAIFAKQYKDPHLRTKFNLVYAGRISEDKNLKFLIDVVKNLDSEEFNCILVGDGPALVDLKNLTKKNGRFRFLGKISNAEMALVFNGADLLLFPSTIDTFGMTVVEAQACGTPALVTKIGGPKDIIIEGLTGFSLDLEKQIWINKIIELKNNPWLRHRMNLNSYYHIKENYDLRKIIKGY